MNFMEELEKETQAMLKQINIRKIEKTENAKKRISELKTLIKFWEEDLWKNLLLLITSLLTKK